MSTNSINSDYLGKYNPGHQGIVEDHKVAEPQVARTKSASSIQQLLVRLQENCP